MPATDSVVSAPPALPEGYLAAALFPEAAGSAVRIGIVARKTADTVAGHFVILRTLLDGVVYLGCLTDAGGRVHGYVEIWAQSLDGLSASPSAAREALSNRILDERWGKLFKAYDALDGQTPSAVVRTGFETAHPEPLFYDVEKKETLHPVDAFSNLPWKLCTDDGVLASKGLPPYSSSLHRYLWADAKSPLIPVTPDAPTPAGTAPLTEITGGAGGAGPKGGLKMIHAGGLLLVRRYDPIALEAIFELLSGGAWDGILAGRTAVHLNKLNEALEEKSGTDMADGRLFLGKHGKWGRLVETFHLKLRLLADCLEHVRLFTAQTQRPLLNITAQSFQVDVGAAQAHALPFLWTSAATLVDPGDAVTLKIEGAEAQYFVRGIAAPGNVYQPESVSRPASGRGLLRIRKTMAEASGLILEGTFSTQDRLGSGGGGEAAEPTRNDLMWLRVPIGSQRVDLFGHVEKDSALARGEWRFRTERQRMAEPLVAQIKAAEGVPIPETLFEVIPLLSSPCDMYSLAVVAARALLVDADTTLAIATDELLSLARQVGLEANADRRLGERIEAIFNKDSRWLNSLGPHRLTRETLSPQEAFDLVPSNLWFGTLGLLVQMLPGMGPDSFCRNYGDAPRGGLHKVYEEAQNALDTLLVRTRSLIVIDWRFNREIHAVLRRF